MSFVVKRNVTSEVAVYKRGHYTQDHCIMCLCHITLRIQTLILVFTFHGKTTSTNGVRKGVGRDAFTAVLVTPLTATSVVTYLCFHVINMLTVMKVKFSLSTPRTLMWVGGTSPLIRNFVTRWRYWSASHSVRFTPKERTATSTE